MAPSAGKFFRLRRLTGVDKLGRRFVAAVSGLAAVRIAVSQGWLPRPKAGQVLDGIRKL
jgi:hypothetical protein